MVAANRLLLLCAAVLALPAIAAAQTSAVIPGWYTNTNAPFQTDSNWRIVWQNSYVYEYPAGSPLYWYVQVIYRNISNKNLTINCAPSSMNLTPVREYMQGTANSGYVDAADTFCTRNSGWSTNLMPGYAFNDWAIFHNVPWPGSEVSIEWQPYGSTPWIDPWATGPFFGRPPDVCPPELVTLGTCKPPPIATRELGDDERQALEDFVTCETDLLTALGFVAGATLGATVGPVAVAVVAGVAIASKITDIVGQGTALIALVQDPTNPNKYIELVLEFVPGRSCLRITQAASRGANKTIITPLINAVTH